MRILLITQGMSPVVVPLFQSHHKIVGIAEDGPRVPITSIQIEIKKMVLTAFNLVNKNVQTLPHFCKKNNISFFFIKDIQDQSFENWILMQKPDLIVVYSMSHLLKKTIFSIPVYGAINLHPSYLPRYRGPNPYFWLYYTMDPTGGVTVHYIDEGEDTGDIIFQVQIPLPIGIPMLRLRSQLIDEIGTKILIDAINAIEKGIAPRVPQPKESPTMRARNLLKGEAKMLIDWKSWDIKRIWHLVSGYSGIYDFIGYVDRPYIGHKTIVKNFIECPVQKKNIGKIGINPDGSRYITCANGKIIYLFHFDLPHRIRMVLRGLLKINYSQEPKF